MNLAQTLDPLETERETLLLSWTPLQTAGVSGRQGKTQLGAQHEIQHEHKTKFPFIEKNASETTAISLMF